MATFTLKRGDTSPALRYTLSPATIDLAGATVRFSMAQAEGAPLIYRAPATVVTTSPPVVEYAWQPGDTRRVGIHDAEFEVTFPGGAVETFPNNSFIPVSILPDAGWRPQPPTEVITWTLGDATTEPLILTDDQGQPLDLTNATVTINVRVGAAWVQQVATVHDPLIGEAWPDWAAMDLAPRVYPMTITTTWPDGPATDPRHYVLNVQER